MEYTKESLKNAVSTGKEKVIMLNDSSNKKRLGDELEYLALKGKDVDDIKEKLEEGKTVVADKMVSDLKAKEVNKTARIQVGGMIIALLLLIITAPFITQFVIDKGLFFMITNTITVLIGLIILVGLKAVYEFIRMSLFFKDGVSSAINGNFKHVIYSLGFLTTFMYVTYKLINILLTVSK